MKVIYKTEKGYFKNQFTDFCSIEDFFGDKTFYYNKHRKQIYRVASVELKSMIADRFINRVFDNKTKAEKEKIKEALINRTGNLSFFQSFYTNGGNSLSGDAYDYCKRGFLKSIY